jgi:hypothetical protein
MSKDELEIQYIRRKNRITGRIYLLFYLSLDVRFIGDLLIVNVLPESVVSIVANHLLTKYLENIFLE